jgi:serine/threonine protein kinase
VLNRTDAELALEKLDRNAATPAQPVTVALLLDALRQHQLVSPEQVAELARAPSGQPRGLARELLRRNWLTPYQVNQLVQGRGAELILGPYLLLERLGEGGAGQVFKARHRKLGRVVAVKVLRNELLTDAEVVGRFYREIEVLSQFDHPNIVHAYDAGPVIATHFLAMEFVEGTDLGKLVKQGGPLPVQQACEYIRQAAGGLAHAHERGLVHRDIKPHNLIMSVRDGLIKVADLGLARLPRTTNTELTAALSGVKGTGTLTPENAGMMGTADYLAPEQALDFHKADIRADIYSLGCAFYYLLTGQPPFPGATLAEKLVKHQQAPPPPLEQFRKDLPSGLSLVISKMLAKRPEQRYQTPADVATALGHFCQPQGANLMPMPDKKRKLYLAGTAVAILLIVAFLVFFRSPPTSPAQVAWKPLRIAFDKAALARFKNAKEVDWLRQDIIKFRMDYPGTPEALQAAEWMTELPSPFDRLEAKTIPADLRYPGQPKELVAVWGKKGAGEISAIAISPNGKFVAASIKDHIQVWDAGTGKELTTWAGGFGSPAFSPDGSILAATGPNSSIRLWGTAGWKQQASLQGHARYIYSIAFSPDGKTLASGGEPGVVKLWDIEAKRERAALEGHGPNISLAFSPDGGTLAVVSYNKPIMFWDVATGQQRNLPYAPQADAVAYSPDGRTLFWVGRPLLPVTDKVICDSADGQELLRLADPYSLFGPTFFVNGKELVGGVPRFSIFVYDTTTGKRKRELARSNNTHYCLDLAPDNRHLAVGDFDGTVYIYRLAAPPTNPAR